MLWLVAVAFRTSLLSDCLPVMRPDKRKGCYDAELLEGYDSYGAFQECFIDCASLQVGGLFSLLLFDFAL